jgi:hypothetical protein
MPADDPQLLTIVHGESALRSIGKLISTKPTCSPAASLNVLSSALHRACMFNVFIGFTILVEALKCATAAGTYKMIVRVHYWPLVP